MKKNAGFTLIEVIIVIAIIGITAAFAIPTFLKQLPNWRAKAATTDLFSNLQLAKVTAISKGTNCAVTFTGDPGGGVPSQYQINIVNTAGAVLQVMKTVSLADYGSEVEFRGPEPEYRRFDSNPLSAASYTLTFNSRGMVPTGGSAGFVYFSSGKFADLDPEKTYYRAGVTTAGVIQMQRKEGDEFK